MGNAVYRDLVQALVMVELEHQILAVPNTYKFKTGGKETLSRDYDNLVSVADARGRSSVDLGAWEAAYSWGSPSSSGIGELPKKPVEEVQLRCPEGSGPRSNALRCDGPIRSTRRC